MLRRAKRSKIEVVTPKEEEVVTQIKPSMGLLHGRADPIKALRKREIKHLQISFLLRTFLLRIATINNSLFVIALKKLKKNLTLLCTVKTICDALQLE